ncbi:MAG: ribosome maturation factor RimM [Polyangia bacterium]|jgi:16S rRNA processing protein RimM
MEPRWLPFGLLGRPHGVRGEIKLSLYNLRAAGAAGVWPGGLPAEVRWIKGERAVSLRVVACRPVVRGWLIRMADLDDRNAVAELVGGEIQVRRADLPRLDGQEFFVADVVGCLACLAGGQRLGLVKGTFWNGEHDVMAIVDDEGEEHLLPVLPAFVLSFDAALRRVTVDPHE